MPDTPMVKSADREAMDAYYGMIADIMGGIETMRAAGSTHLPPFRRETVKRYEERLGLTKFTAIFVDIIENLAQRPFAKPVQIAEGSAPDALVEFGWDVDACGTRLHEFGGNLFYTGIAYSIGWVLVDYPRAIRPRASIAEERAAGIRPRFVMIDPRDVLEARTAMIEGREQFVHFRYIERTRQRDGRFSDKDVTRVRLYERPEISQGSYGPAQFSIWEKKETAPGGQDEWYVVEEGPITIGVVPVVPFVVGRREGKSWRTVPPMKHAAEVQVELYQEESALKYASNLTAFPMLAGNGVEPSYGDDGKAETVAVGPHVVLYAPDGGTWSFVEPSGESLRLLREGINETKRELRELGRQPLTAQSGNLTRITTAVAAQKGNSAVQAWAINLKACLEAALEFAAMWMSVDAPDLAVTVDTDFDHSWDDDDTYGHVLALRATGDISRTAALHEAKRRGVIDKDYDEEADAEVILAEDIEGDDEIAPPVIGAA